MNSINRNDKDIIVYYKLPVAAIMNSINRNDKDMTVYYKLPVATLTPW